MDLRKFAQGKVCVRCKSTDTSTVVLAHYFGPRRHDYGGGMSRKGHDAVGAHLCLMCHRIMDTLGRDKNGRWLESEEFLHLCALTWIRVCEAIEAGEL